MIDSFYTPDKIAAYMAKQVTLKAPKSVADFAAGDGILLTHAVDRWNPIRVYATDIDDQTVRKLRREHTDWSVSKCDFLSSRSRACSNVLGSAVERVDLILLNPPYSCRGARSFKVAMGDVSVKCSKALAFVLLATRYLAEDGQIVAILPQSSFNSEKDDAAWRFIEGRFTVRRGSTAGRGVFDNCFARCTVVRLSPRKRGKPKRIISSVPPAKVKVRLVRGSVPLHLFTGDDYTLVHSTDLVGGMVELNGHVASKDRPWLSGPSILFPRVGQPRIDKVAIFRQRKRVVLSDCVIGLQCKCVSDVNWLYDKIIRNGKGYMTLYSGTCARYTTVQRVVDFLASLGCEVEH